MLDLLSAWPRLLAKFLLIASFASADELRPMPLQSKITDVQPFTGMVLWTTNEHADRSSIQLEYIYLRYDQVVEDKDKYNWSAVDQVLTAVANRGHQVILRWHDTYVGRPNGLPGYIQALPHYRGVTANSESQPTGFPDWSVSEAQDFVLDFFTRFSQRYDQDSRLAYVQVGFGLWAEYHIYDGPMQLGRTFPSLEFQEKFLRHLNGCFRKTPWMVSVDAAGEHSPLASAASLGALGYGLFDDSFNHRQHAQENAPNWAALGPDRWQRSPAGGEFSFFQPKDQRLALAPNGPHGIAFEEQAAKFHITFMIADDQPRFQKPERIRQAGMSCGYRFRVTEFLVGSDRSRVAMTNEGIAPIYFDAFPAIEGIRSTTSLKGLLPGESRAFDIRAGGTKPTLTIECDRLVPGQRIQFVADL